MKYYCLEARLLAPLMIQQSRRSNAPAGLRHLTGSTLRGALARKWLQEVGSAEDEGFRRLFLEDPVHFPDLLPAPPGADTHPGEPVRADARAGADTQAGAQVRAGADTQVRPYGFTAIVGADLGVRPGTHPESAPAHPESAPLGPVPVIPRPLPLTAVSCKRKPGFLAHGAHGAGDSLAMVAMGRLEGREVEGGAWECRHCRQDLKPLAGVWNGDPERPCKLDPAMIFERHTGIDRQTGTVAQSIFFTTQAMADWRKEEGSDDFFPQVLAGGLYLDDKQLEHLRPLVEEGTVFAGAERTRGFGELELALREAAPPSWSVREWDEKFRAKYAGLKGSEPPEGVYFSLLALSPAVWVDELLRPSGEPDFSFPGAECVAKALKVRTVRGWQSAWGLPKPDDRAVSAGSVFLFRYRGEDLEGLEKSLKSLEREGWGLRREEGFGRVGVCEPLHNVEVI